MSERDRLRILSALLEEVGFRALIRFQSEPRDLRWFRSLTWKRTV